MITLFLAPMIQQDLVSHQSFQASHQVMAVDPRIVLSQVPRKQSIYCPCCSDVLLRHISRSGVYQLCQTCHQKMPDLEAILIQHSLRQMNSP
jgi:hypothetical protein